jgi:hypothetical protein
MRKRGPKSSEELAIAGLAAVTGHVRPEPPYDLLTEEGASIFRTIVDSLPADWFSPGSVPVLVQLVKHVVASRRIAELIAQEERRKDYDFERHDRFLKAQERQSAAIQRLATSLRLTPQSRYTPQRAATQGETLGPRPWEWSGPVSEAE